MIDRTELMAKAVAWMQARGWKRKLAKQRGREQSLFEDRLQASAFGLQGFADEQGSYQVEALSSRRRIGGAG
ncbi:MAG TPA: hypothetical protein VMW56_00275, partial [Candidatus Margulisiibacteriota bacterium]|nr:hypothetical protein [Candidatus Margulisiibacteriota bacterium]